MKQPTKACSPSCMMIYMLRKFWKLFIFFLKNVSSSFLYFIEATAKTTQRLDSGFAPFESLSTEMFPGSLKGCV